GESFPPLRTGDVVDRYQVQGVLGAGARGFVFTAFDPDLDRTVALNLIGDESQAEVLREAHAVGRLKHPNGVTVYDVGADRGHVFVAMELVDGQPLDAWLAAGARPWRAIRDVFLEAGRGLAAAHAAGIAHGDFKPSNVIASASRVVVVGF